jgi:acetyl-CoA carboxylase biotin carboxylase subunit
MEARIIAENPLAGFMPGAGRIDRVRFPSGPGVRNDAGFYRGFEIPVYYDSLISKLIVWGQDREQARRRMDRALSEFVIEGVPQNLAFHRWLVSHPEFIAGRLSTRFIEEHFRPEALAPGPDATGIALLAAALHAREERLRVTLPERRGGSPARSAWRWGERRRPGARARR